LRDARAERLMDSEQHYKVQGIANVDGEKHPWTCEVKNRHVIAAEYSGPKQDSMSTAGKLAIGAIAAVAAGMAINEMSKGKDETATHTESSDGGGNGAVSMPKWNVSCPGMEVYADQDGTVYINGKKAEVTKFNDNYYEATRSGLTLSVSIAPDGSESVSYTGKHGTHGVCRSKK
jgi:hypothetical protein